jgi:hypothetical protein
VAKSLFGGPKVISISKFQNDQMMPAIAQVEAYWHGLRDAGSIPRRSDVDPRGIQDALENAFIIERIAPGIARFRLAGMHLTDLLGMDVRGMPFSAFFAPALRNEMTPQIEAIFSDPAIVSFDLEAEGGYGKPSLKGKMVLMPLTNDSGDVTRALGVLVTDGKLGRTPRRFGKLECHMRPINNAGLRVEIDPPNPEPPVSRGAPFIEPTARPVSLSSGRPALRLVKSDTWTTND